MPTGIIIIDKPQNWTSMDVCGKLRRLYGERRVGHAGTLDPMATGVLPVFVGRATRAVEFAEHGEKEYLAGLRLGISTDTQDTTGEVLAEQPVACSREDIEAVLHRFRGDIEQIPPMYSALKVNGQKLYQLARKGKTVERKPRPITIYELELGEQIGENEYALRVKCSKGTYIRRKRDGGVFAAARGSVFPPLSRRHHWGRGRAPLPERERLSLQRRGWALPGLQRRGRFPHAGRADRRRDADKKEFF